MRIFISWSGELSRNVAVALKGWLKYLFDSVDPFVSSIDINKGSKWSTTLLTELDGSDFGIICLTRGNIGEPWINFEAGALSKSLKNSRVCTLLLDKLLPSEIQGPLASFQHTQFNKEDFRELLSSINDWLNENKIDESVIDKRLDSYWSQIDAEISDIFSRRKSPHSRTQPTSKLEIIKALASRSEQGDGEMFLAKDGSEEFEEYSHVEDDEEKDVRARSLDDTWVDLKEADPKSLYKLRMAETPLGLLHILSAPQAGLCIFLTERTGTIKFGRVDFGLDDDFMSEDHFRILKETVDNKNGSSRVFEFSLQDLESTNGTFVNGERVMVTKLRTGDLIEAGSTRIRVHVFQKAD